MADLSLVNALKTAFSALGAKTSDSNYAVGLFDKTTAEPKGIMGMSDLASVLGGMNYIRTITSNTDILNNDSIVQGTYFINNTGGVINMPANESSGYLIKFDTKSIAVFLSYDNNALYYVLNVNNTWQSWKKVGG